MVSSIITLDQAREALLELAAQQHTNHFRIGQIYNYTVREKLAEKYAKKSAQDYFSEHVKTLSKTVLGNDRREARDFDLRDRGKARALVAGAWTRKFARMGAQRLGLWAPQPPSRHAKRLK